jgi:hypothetical protein
MATLTSTKIKNTYDALLKSIDNDAIGTTAKQITDGLGNTTPLYVSTTQVGIGVTPEAGLNLHVFGDAKIGSNLTVIGNLVVEGSTTTVGTDTLTVKDPLIVLANNNTSTDAVDIGFYGKYTPSGTTLYSGLFREALTGKYRLFKGLEDEPTTTVNTSGTGYAVATLVSDLEGTLTGVIASTTTATTQSANDNSTKVATTAYVDNQVGLYDTLSEVLANGNTSGANDIIMEDGQKINFGTDSDLEMYHDGTDGYIDNINGELILQNNSDDKKIIFKSDNGIGDITEYFRIDGNINRNVITVTTQLNDDVPLIFGDGAARPSIKYDSTATDLIVSTNGSTALTIDTSQNATFSGTISGVLADGVTATTQSDGDNSTKVATTAYVDTAIEGHDTLAEVLAGGNTTGGTDIAVSANDDITFADNSKIIFGDGGDIEMFFNGGTFVIDDTSEVQQGIDIDTNIVRFRGTDLYMEIGNAQHTFWTTGTQRLQINSSGVTIDGDLTVDLNTLFVDASANSVGINLTNPSDYTADELVISVPDGSGMTLVSASTDAAYITFMSSTGAIATNGGYVGYNHDTDTLTNFAQSKVSVAILEAEVAYFTDTAFYVDKSTTIDDNLTVDGTTTIKTDGTTQLILNRADSSIFANNTIGTIQATADDPSAGQVGGQIQFTGADTWSSNFYPTNIIFSNDDAGTLTERMRIDSSGNVGIGTTSPDYLLHLEKSGTIMAQLKATDSNQAYMKFVNSTTGDGAFTDGLLFGLDTDESAVLWNYEATALRFATSGTERMRIDSSGNLGIGETSPSTKVEIKQTNNDIYQLTLYNNNISTTSKARIGNWNDEIKISSNYMQSGGTKTQDNTAKSSWVMSMGAAGDAFDISRSPAASTTLSSLMRIDSSGNSTFAGNVGIGGNASSTHTLDLNSSSNLALRFYDSTTFKAGMQAVDTAGQMIATSAAGDFAIRSQSNMLFSTGGNTERMRIDSSGNVGIGTDSPSKKLHIAGDSATSVITLQRTNTNTTGAYGALQWTASDDHSVAAIDVRGDGDNEGGEITFRTTSAASSNDPYGLSERMRIDSSGNVGIGTTSPYSTLSLELSSATTTTGISTPAGITLQNTNTTDGNYTSIQNRDGNGDQNAEIKFFNVSHTNNQGAIAFTTRSSTGEFAEKMRIDSSGVVSITNSNNGINAYVENDTHNAVFQIKASATGKNSILWFGDSTNDQIGQIDYDHANNSMRFLTAAGERMRITSGGLSKFKSQSGSYGYGTSYNFHEFNNDFGNQPVAMFWQASGSGSHYGINVHNNDDENDTTSRFFLGQGGSTERIKIYSNGNIENTNNSYGQLSDIKLKENVVNATPKLDDLMKVQIKNFNYIGQEQKQIGVIAQELEQIFPNLIYETPKTKREEVNKTDNEGNIIYQTEQRLINEAVEGQEAIEWNDKPTIDNTKIEIQTWLDNNNIEWQSADTKQELLDRIPEYQQEAVEAKEAIYETIETDEPVKENVELATGEVIKGVKYSVFVPMLIKGMQEQQQLINDLKSRIETLENN